MTWPSPPPPFRADVVGSLLRPERVRAARADHATGWARIAEADGFATARAARAEPQCGFASTEEGNALSEDQQWAKLREIVAVAEHTWGALA